MCDFFRDELDARTFLDYVEHLPRTSAYHSAIADDEELAVQMLDKDAPSTSTPRLAEFSPEVQVLAEVRDLLASLIGVQIARAGKKPKKIKPYPRPVSAIERVRKRQQYATHRSVVDRMLPRHE
jgi:hypothetical protein